MKDSLEKAIRNLKCISSDPKPKWPVNAQKTLVKVRNMVDAEKEKYEIATRLSQELSPKDTDGRPSRSLKSFASAEGCVHQFLFENANAGIGVIQDGAFKFFNRKVLDITGISEEEIQTKKIDELIHPGDRNMILNRFRKRLNGEDVPNMFMFRTLGKNHEIRWIETNSSLISWEGKPAILNIFTDKTHAKLAEEALRESETRYKTLFEYANDAIFFETENREIIDVNHRACEMFGYTRSELLTMKTSELLLPSEKGISIYSDPDLFLDTPIEMPALHRDGTELSIEFTITPLISGRQTLFMTIARDITEKKQARDRIRYLALHDKLTGLPNRNLFFDRLSHAIRRANRYKHVVALLYIDLDGFKPINDTLGHKAGDFVLKEVARRFKKCIRESDTAARIGGDEFVIILQDLEKKQNAGIVAQKIIDSVTQTISISESCCHVGASIGISAYPCDGLNADTLMQKADAAMYQVKKNGKNNYSFFDID